MKKLLLFVAVILITNVVFSQTSTNSAYPKEKVSYWNKAEAYADNPDTEITFVCTERGLYWALADFPTMKRPEGKTSWWSAEEAWAQLGKQTKLICDEKGNYTVYDPRIKGVIVEFKKMYERQL